MPERGLRPLKLTAEGGLVLVYVAVMPSLYGEPAHYEPILRVTLHGRDPLSYRLDPKGENLGHLRRDRAQ